MESKKLLKTVGFYDFIIGSVFSLVLYIFFKEQGGIFLWGIGISYINLLINSYALRSLTIASNVFKAITLLFSYFIRIFLVCGIGILLFMINPSNIFIFIGGYTAQFLSICLYSMKIKEEGVWFNGGG